MAQTEQVIMGLQAIVTALSQQADGHVIQSLIFKSEGFNKLADKYAEHAEEERGYVGKCITRIINLGGEVKNEDKKAAPVYTDPVEWVKYDLQVSREGLKGLAQLVEMTQGDYTTYDMLKDYYKDEEEDKNWGEDQLALIDKIGVQNWLYAQL